MHVTFCLLWFRCFYNVAVRTVDHRTCVFLILVLFAVIITVVVLACAYPHRGRRHEATADPPPLARTVASFLATHLAPGL